MSKGLKIFITYAHKNTEAKDKLFGIKNKDKEFMDV